MLGLPHDKMRETAERRHSDEKNSKSDDIFGQHRGDAGVPSQSHNTTEMRDTPGKLTEAAPATSNSEEDSNPATVDTNGQKDGVIAKFLESINWMPPWCRYDPHKPPKFTLSMNILLAFV
jgi:hypothetical protein